MNLFKPLNLFKPVDHYQRPDNHGHQPPDKNPVKKLEARAPDGSNNDGDNNPANDQGTHDSTFVRVTPNSYADGIGAMPTQQPGVNPATATDLPSPRAVSNAVMNQGTADIPNTFGVNEFFQFFGQAITHDVAEAATGASGDPPLFVAGLPFPFTRTPYEDGTAATGPRQQTNEETSFLDLSMVYGNNQALLDLVRADLPGHAGQSAKLLLGVDGLLPTIKQAADDSGKTSLEVLGIFRPAGFGGLPDPATNPDPATFENFYFAGDNRVNQTPLLISQQTIWARNHNFWVDVLQEKHPTWTQDQLFNAARALNEAEWQNVIYSEYLPKLLGKYAISEYEGYKSSVDPSIINEWTTVAFRFGHDQSSQNQKPLNEDGGAAAIPGFTLFTLAEAFAAGANGARTTQDIDSWIRGQLASHTQEIDGLVVDGNRNTLFGIPGAPGQFTTVDLEVFDIQRARDHGVWNYNDLRAGLGLSTYTSFDEFGAANNIDPARLAALKTVYGDDINKLDSIIGGLLEAKYHDSQLGETFTKLTVLQFENLRDGDRLFYENRFADNPELIEQIESTSFAEILQRNTGIEHVYRDGFAAHDRISATDGKLDGSAAKDLAIGSDLADVIKTYGDADDIYGGKGNDKIYAGAGSDRIYGDGGDDWLWGEGGKDVFILTKGSGKDKIQDFDVKADKIDLSDYGLNSWKDVSKALQTTSKGVTIKLDGYNTVELVGVKAKSLSEKNFIFDDHDAYAV